MSRARDLAIWVTSRTRRIVVTIVGFALVAAGLVMLVLPGPGILAVVAGLAVLATEYAWARRALDEAKRRTGDTARRLRRGRKGRR